MSPVIKSHSGTSHQFISGMNYSFSNSAISLSHQALGDFDAGILHCSFGGTGCQWRGRESCSRDAAGVGSAWVSRSQLASDFQMRCITRASNYDVAPPHTHFCVTPPLSLPPAVCPPRALPGMMQWIRSQRPGENGINIITADFVELGEFISAVISLNYHLDDDEDDATWGVAGRGGERRGSTVTSGWRPVLQCVLSFFSLWHLFQEEGRTASFTLFRAMMTGELKGVKAG